MPPAATQEKRGKDEVQDDESEDDDESLENRAARKQTENTRQTEKAGLKGFDFHTGRYFLGVVSERISYHHIHHKVDVGAWHTNAITGRKSTKILHRSKKVSQVLSFWTERFAGMCVGFPLLVCAIVHFVSVHCRPGNVERA